MHGTDHRESDRSEIGSEFYNYKSLKEVSMYQRFHSFERFCIHGVLGDRCMSSEISYTIEDNISEYITKDSQEENERKRKDSCRCKKSPDKYNDRSL